MEPFGIDESWLDVTGTWQLFAESPAALADQLRAEVKAATGLTISVGVSFNKVFAKLGSDYKKPDATTLITRENFHQIVWPLPAGDLLYVGASAQGGWPAWAFPPSASWRRPGPRLWPKLWASWGWS